MNDNNITLKAYTSGATLANDAGLDAAQDVQFTKSYPGGMCTGMTFYVPRDITAFWSVQIGQRITANNGLEMAWEGFISSITPSLTTDGQGMLVTCEGAWSRFLQRRYTRKPWADTRLDEAAWATPITAAAANDKTIFQWATVDRNGRIRFNPRSTRDAAGNETGWSTNDYVRVVYTAPTGQTIKRITLSYDLQEGAQAWRLSIYDPTGAADIGSVVEASGTGTKDETLGTPRQSIWLYMSSRANQSPPTDGTVYADFTNVVVYTETGNINAQEITKDVRAAVSGLSADETQIGALTLSLVPFIAEGAENYADLLTRAASYGDASFNRWACYVGMSQDASDSLPRLVLEQVPALTDYDYSVRMDDPNVSSDIQFTQDLDPVRNWIAVHYQDTNGRGVWVTPDDDANLKDTTSITAYGQREEWLDVPTTDLTGAKNYGRRYLAQRKDAQWTATGQLSVTGYIRAKSGRTVPASEIAPGKRVKFENWLNDLSGTGLTLLISGTTYDDAGETCGIDFGQPDTLDVYTLRLQRELEAKR
jgi:hypothetical protein